MLKTRVIGFVFAGFLTFGAFGQEVVVRVAPPHPLAEVRGIAPGPRYVWIGGYHRWDGRAYVWVPGRWELPPRAHARWVAAHWAHRHGGWVLVEGRWR